MNMAMVFDQLPEIDFSDFTTTTAAASTSNSTTTHEDDKCHNWGDRSTVVDWDVLADHPEENFAELFESEMEEEIDKTVSYSDNDDQNLGSSDLKGLRLVHLLMAAAEAISSDNKIHDLAGVILVRLKDLVSSNCMLNLPHFSHRTPSLVASFLTGSKNLNPKLVTLVEEEGVKVKGGFVVRFMDTLHHYSAMYDSLEAGFPMQGRARALVERVFLGPQIVGSVAQVFQVEGACGLWGEWLKSESGFQPVNISFSVLESLSGETVVRVVS